MVPAGRRRPAGKGSVARGRLRPTEDSAHGGRRRPSRLMKNCLLTLGLDVGNKNAVEGRVKLGLGQRRRYLKITWVWSDFFNKLLRLEELTPEEHLLLSVEAPNYGPEVESQWEEATRQRFEDR